MEPVQLPDEDAFRAFQAECEAEQGWLSRYSRDGIAVWGQLPAAGAAFSVHRVKGRVDMPGVPAETAYDVLHDTEYRKKWDLNVIETHDIARVADNADVGYYSWKCPKPLKNRDVVTLRSWQVLDNSYVIINFSVKHPKYPPRKDLVRAVSLLAGYLVQSTGPDSCVLTYLAQVDPKGSLPKWVVNKASQYLAPKLMKKMYKACLKYPAWKQEHNVDTKPWLHPEQNQLPTLPVSDLALQHASSLENIDESSLMEAKEEKGDTSGSEN
ncbi:START domain-containing protein 10-like [Hemicordylus capensis]|uniref:START domain-containing protein 10-like n=1 Tax=Hemicordylus capensis TaxID=884348 RepID=UPI00230300C7|nr:START domain-containing protein 10-like [Hemicordylus capensis]